LDSRSWRNHFPKQIEPLSIEPSKPLKTFEEKGIVHSIDNGVAEVKYALCHEDCTEQEHSDQHPHFHCLKCQETTCLESVFIPAISLPVGFDTKEVSMTIKGICKNCQE